MYFKPVKFLVAFLGALTFCLTMAKMSETLFGESFSDTPTEAYQVILPNSAGKYFPRTPYMLADILQTTLPDDVVVARRLKWPLSVKLPSDETTYANVEFIEPSVFPVLNLGVSNQISDRPFGEPNNIVISRTFAERFLGGEKALGQEIEVKLQSGNQAMIVTAILNSKSSLSEIGRSDVFIRLDANYFSNTPYLFRSSKSAQFTTYMTIPDERLGQVKATLKSINSSFNKSVGSQKLLTREATILKMRQAPKAHLSGRLAAMNYAPRTIFRMLFLLSISALFTTMIAMAVFTLMDYRKTIENLAIQNLLGRSRRNMALELFTYSLPSIFLGTLIGLLVSGILTLGPLREIETPLKSQYLTLVLSSVIFLTIITATTMISALLALTTLVAERIISGMLEHSKLEEFFIQLSFAFQVMVCSVSVSTAIYVGLSLTELLNRDRGFNQDNVVFVAGLSYEEVPKTIRRLNSEFGEGSASAAFLRLGTNMQGFPVKIIRNDGRATAVVTQTDYTGPLLSILEVETLSGLDAKSSELWNKNQVVINASAADSLGFETPQSAIGAKLIRSSVDVGSTSMFPRTTLTVVSVIKDVELQSPFGVSQPTLFAQGGFPASVVLRLKDSSEYNAVSDSIRNNTTSIIQIRDFYDVETVAFVEETRAATRIAYAGSFLAINSVAIIGALLLQFMALKGKRVNIYTRLGARLRDSISVFLVEPVFIGISSLTTGVVFAWAISPLLQRHIPITPPSWYLITSLTTLVIFTVISFGMIAPIYVLKKS